MRSLSDYYHSAKDTLAWYSLWWQVLFLRWLIAASSLERAALTDPDVRAYLTACIAKHQADLDRLYINNLPLIERRLQAKGSTT